MTTESSKEQARPISRTLSKPITKKPQRFYDDVDSILTSDKPPPTTIDEFISVFELADWPDDSNLQIRDSKSYGVYDSFDKVKQKLLEATEVCTTNMNSLESQVDNFSKGVEDISKYIYEEEKSTVSKKNSFHIPSQTFLTEISNRQITACKAGLLDNVVDNKLISKQRIAGNIRNAHFPGFNPRALTPLPNNIEMMSLIDRVLKLQKLPSRLTQHIQTICLSKSSVCYCQDAFWWLLIDFFKDSAAQNEKSKENLLQRMAQSFADLQFSIHESLRDSIHKVLCEILSQSLFLAFIDCFPESSNLFNPDFRLYIHNQTNLWLNGMPSDIESHLFWQVGNLTRDKKESQEKLKSQAAIQFNEKVLDQLIEKARAEQNSSVREKSQDHESTMVVVEKKKKPSHPIGKGVQFAKVNFNMKGTSGLVSQFIKQHDIAPFPKQMTGRNQPISLPDANAKTYAELITETRKRSKQVSKKLAKLERETAEEIAKIRKSYAISERATEHSIKQIQTGKVTRDEVKNMAKEIRERATSGNANLTGSMESLHPPKFDFSGLKNYETDESQE